MSLPFLYPGGSASGLSATGAQWPLPMMSTIYTEPRAIASRGNHLFQFSLRSRCTATLAGLRTLKRRQFETRHPNVNAFTYVGRLFEHSPGGLPPSEVVRGVMRVTHFLKVREVQNDQDLCLNRDKLVNLLCWRTCDGFVALSRFCCLDRFAFSRSLRSGFLRLPPGSRE